MCQCQPERGSDTDVVEQMVWKAVVPSKHQREAQSRSVQGSLETSEAALRSCPIPLRSFTVEPIIVAESGRIIEFEAHPSFEKNAFLSI